VLWQQELRLGSINARLRENKRTYSLNNTVDPPGIPNLDWTMGGPKHLELAYKLVNLSSNPTRSLRGTARPEQVEGHSLRNGTCLPSSMLKPGSRMRLIIKDLLRPMTLLFLFVSLQTQRGGEKKTDLELLMARLRRGTMRYDLALWLYHTIRDELTVHLR
jgi:hypothetical protein